jgi:hypothetical protein
LVQITRTTPLRRTTLHLSQIFFTDALTFIVASLFYNCRTLNLFNDPAPARIIRHQRHPHPITDDHADVIASDGTRQVRRHLMRLSLAAIELDPNQLAREQLADDAFGGPIL